MHVYFVQDVNSCSLSLLVNRTTKSTTGAAIVNAARRSQHLPTNDITF